jgi:acetate kinase
MGARIDDAANAAHGPRLHTAGSTIGLWVVPTDEEAVIAGHTDALVSWR